PAARTPRVAIAPAPRAPRPASFARRGIALFLDLMLLSLLDAVLMMLATTAVLLAERVTGARIGGAVQLIRSAVSAGSLTLLVGYFSVLHARSGQTLGKAAMQIEVRSANGGRVGILPSVLRTFSYALSLLPFGAGFLLALLPPQRALHDHIAGTRVVRVEDHE
ncbi:RDD family protein, partial [Candidatus Binatia bacterium]|nr:RDD family protein [Candidatus Binatia bacterium]